ncbi:alpha/beta hydrolase [Streptomyces sp. GKU 257-1]|nr:alpha/beta hydrolase [Streptomyces sp. GKU 257-1]
MSRILQGLTGRYAPPAPARELTARSGDGGCASPSRCTAGPATPRSSSPTAGPVSTLFWAPVIRDLTASGHRVVVYDQRGHGRSPAPATPMACSTAMLADDLCAVLEAALEPGGARRHRRPLDGRHDDHGSGGPAAAARARRRAAAVQHRSAASDGAGPGAAVPLGAGARGSHAHRALLGSSAPLGPVTPLTRKALAYGTLGPRPERDAVEATARIVHACPTRVRSAWGGVLAGLDLSAKVPHLDAPTAVVAGTHDRLTPLPHAHRMAALLPDCTGVHQLEGRGHMTPLEEPGTVAEVLAGLARDHLATAGRAAKPSKKKEKSA